jgi:glutaredoxin
MGDMADDLMDRMDDIYLNGCDEWCGGCPDCAEDTQWVTRDGKVFEIKNLETSHIVNILNYIRRNRKVRFFGQRRVDNVRREAYKRGCFEKAMVWVAPCLLTSC